MAPKKKKASGDAAKGEKVFKNLCGVCHSLSVSIYLFYLFPNQAQLLERIFWDNVGAVFYRKFDFNLSKCSIGSFNWSSSRWNRWIKYCVLWRVLLLFISIVKSYFEMVCCQLGQMAKGPSWLRSRKRYGFLRNPIGERQSWSHCLSHGLK